ncbi:MAG: hypothetical protein AVDCRST_MAG19-64 [uncultured Thermomicrobiales bacterium]|uniref:Luciferase-like domain-containing protein n=1 Tax=uncultured Thermomicrobiales bacterium TaxID=1645740 RepID=A0A6J4UAH7_9BACT|nr:MAG: hypothetical protein AVDCRST_MAG19-64 [uncultured Thermomicrobiales bacterium]
MLRLAARHADVWDTFPPIPKAATDGMTDTMADRVRHFDGACRDAGRDPAVVRRSTWTGSAALQSEAAFRAWVGEHRALGFTDFTAGLPGPAHHPAVRRIAAAVLPELRGATV